MSENTFSLPADVTPAKAREMVAAEMGKLAREVGSLRQAVSDRDRVISTLKATIGDQDAIIERQEETVRALRDNQRGGADPALRAELTAWRGVVEYGLGRVVALLEEATAPTPAQEIDTAEAALARCKSLAEPAQAEAEREPLPQPSPAAKQCRVAWCDTKRNSKDGYCMAHKTRLTTHGDALLIKRRVNGVYTLCRETGAGTFERVEVAG